MGITDANATILIGEMQLGSPIFRMGLGLIGGVYIPSIYQGLKDVDGEENVATGVTAYEVSNATGTGTVTVYVDGVALDPVFNTANESERFWTVEEWSGTRPVVSWVMSGVTSFELGQGTT